MHSEQNVNKIFKITKTLTNKRKCNSSDKKLRGKTVNYHSKMLKAKEIGTGTGSVLFL